MCNLEDCCEHCHDWPDEKCHRIGEYLAKLSSQHKKKHERKAKAFSSSFFRILPFYACPPL